MKARLSFIPYTIIPRHIGGDFLLPILCACVCEKAICYSCYSATVTMFADANERNRHIRHLSRGLRAPCREAPPRCFS